MFQMITIAISIISIVIAFFSPPWGWIVLTLPILISIITLWSFKLRLKARSYIHELSSVANAVLDRFGYYYGMPFACRDFSASAEILDYLTGHLKYKFNPTLREGRYISKETHDEIVSFIQRKKEETVSFTQHKQE